MVKRIIASFILTGLLLTPFYWLFGQLVARYQASREAPDYQVLGTFDQTPSSGLKDYHNRQYGFGFSYHPDLELETDTSLTVDNHILQLKLNKGNQSKTVFTTRWLINVWNRITTDTQITNFYFPGFQLLSENEVVIAGKKSRELVFRGPAAVTTQSSVYRFYIIKTPYYTYTLTSGSCHHRLEDSCLSLLSTFTTGLPDYD